MRKRGREIVRKAEGKALSGQIVKQIISEDNIINTEYFSIYMKHNQVMHNLWGQNNALI